MTGEHSNAPTPLATETDLAFPCSMPTGIKDGHPLGLTKRELFAGKAMQALLQDSRWEIGTEGARNTAHWATVYADALLKELAK